MLYWSIWLPLMIACAGFGYGLGERNARKSYEDLLSTLHSKPGGGGIGC